MMESNVKQKEFLKIWAVCIVMIALTVMFLIPADVSAGNNKPVAVIDGTLNVKQGGTVYLDGTLSSDPDGDNLDYTWTLLSSPNSSLSIISSSSDPQASFKADVAGMYKVRLVVNDGFQNSDPAYAEIRVTE
jgi:hypothetical protein